MISFVGIDERTDLRELDKLASTSLVKLEFGVLYSESKKNNRYPSTRVIQNFASMYKSSLPIYSRSLHLCGTSVKKFLNRDQEFMEDVFKHNDFDAVQLNFSLDAKDDIPTLVKNAVLSCDYVDAPEIIFQANKSKQKLVDYILQNAVSDEGNSVNIRLLYDGSGGFGRQIEKVEKPFHGFYTGYAGGISPETIHKIAYSVEIQSGAVPVYIDMESGVREDGWFCVKKCQKIIEAVNKLKTQSIWNSVE